MANDMQKKSSADTQRLNKVLAQAGLCSRRRADELIDEGRVLVNGRTASAGQQVSPSDVITLDGKPIGRAQKHVYLMLNKPIEVVSTASDPEGRKTVLDFIPEAYAGLRLYPVGRLDYFSEGLILITNDGPLAHELMHPSHEQEKVYAVLVRGDVAESTLEILRGGMTLAEGDKVVPCEVAARTTPHGNTALKFTLHQGLNRQIRRMCRDVGLTILKLRRISEGNLKLGDLATGRIRELTPEEVDSLKTPGKQPFSRDSMRREPGREHGRRGGRGRFSGREGREDGRPQGDSCDRPQGEGRSEDRERRPARPSLGRRPGDSRRGDGEHSSCHQDDRRRDREDRPRRHDRSGQESDSRNAWHSGHHDDSRTRRGGFGHRSEGSKSERRPRKEEQHH